MSEITNFLCQSNFALNPRLMTQYLQIDQQTNRHFYRHTNSLDRQTENSRDTQIVLQTSKSSTDTQNSTDTQKILQTHRHFYRHQRALRTHKILQTHRQDKNKISVDTLNNVVNKQTNKRYYKQEELILYVRKKLQAFNDQNCTSKNEMYAFLQKFLVNRNVAEKVSFTAFCGF